MPEHKDRPGMKYLPNPRGSVYKMNIIIRRETGYKFDWKNLQNKS